MADGSVKKVVEIEKVIKVDDAEKIREIEEKIK